MKLDFVRVHQVGPVSTFIHCIADVRAGQGRHAVSPTNEKQSIELTSFERLLMASSRSKLCGFL